MSLTQNLLFQKRSIEKTGSDRVLGKTILQKGKVREFRENILNVGDSILDAMEKTGGHAIEKHLFKTNNDLIKRVAKDPFITSTSSFTNKKIALRSIKNNLIKNAKEIVEWLDSNPTKPRRFDLVHHNPVGKIVPKKNRPPLYGLLSSGVVLEKDETQKVGFAILSAFPIIK